MARVKLEFRRSNETRAVRWTTAHGKEIKLLITVGFHADGTPREVFCADFKAGSDLHPIVMDACILFSRLLQHDDAPAELARSMCEPPSLLGTIARAVAELD